MKRKKDVVGTKEPHHKLKVNDLCVSNYYGGIMIHRILKIYGDGLADVLLLYANMNFCPWSIGKILSMDLKILYPIKKYPNQIEVFELVNGL